MDIVYRDALLLVQRSKQSSSVNNNKDHHLGQYIILIILQICRPISNQQSDNENG